MRFTADHAFHIGSQHLRGGLPCQDYAISGYGNEVDFAILADGCSSGGQTDVGARIVAHTTAIALKRDTGTLNNETVDFFCRYLDFEAQKKLGLETDDMLATCAYVAAFSDADDIVARIIGDGVLASIDESGDILMARHDWHGNMPAYRAYQFDDYDTFIRAHGGDLSATCAFEHLHARRAGRWDSTVRDLSLGEALKGVTHTISTMTPARKRAVAVFSDGVTQVDGMDWRDVVAELMSFKSTGGAFVKRRMLRFLKDCQAHGKGPIDDISMACIHIDHEAV
ncbi:protein phosphatase 2C domain-containing protein [Bradyrhizobium cenepequi]